MSATLTLKNSINNVKNFMNDIGSSDNSYYMFVGKPTAWLDSNGTNIDNNPPDANMSLQSVELDIYNNMIYGKRLTNNNISILIPKINWVANTVYDCYSTDSETYYLNTYVVTDVYNVYKCLDNNNGARSTIKPSITSTTGSFQTSDGYTWKYMYTVPGGSNFTSNMFVPVVANTYVANNAVPGTIDLIRIKNGGDNWQAYHTGYLQLLQSQQAVVIAANAVSIDNFYTGSSIYLKAGLGADQIRKIVSYDGQNKIATVYPSFKVYATLQLDQASVHGSIFLGQSLFQSIANVGFLYGTGIINKGDNLIQTDTGVTGVVASSNSSYISLNQVSNNLALALNLPMYNSTYSFTPLTGTVSIMSGSNVVTSGTANLQTLSEGTFIQVGNVTNRNIRRITSITNSTSARVSTPFNNTLVANSFNSVSHVFEPYTIVISNNSGSIIQLNLNSMKITYNNVSTNAAQFILGETVKEYDANNVDQSFNAVVSYANSTTLILSSINGTVNLNNFLVGQSSNLKAQISSFVSYPTATVSNVVGSYLIGQPVFAAYGNGSISGSANLLSFSVTPGNKTEYIISPTVNIVGDGSNAVGYAVVNNKIGSNYSLTNIVMINNGLNYTYANVTITSNTLYGENAIVEPVISPIYGHGFDPAEELGGKYLGIAATFDTALNENYFFTNYGSYRQVGILKNPLFNQLFVNYGTPQRMLMNIQLIQNTFNVGEVLYQYSTQAAGIVKAANSTLLEIDNINGTFTTNAIATGGNNLIKGLTSNALANVVSSNVRNFAIISNNQPVYQFNSNVSGVLKQVVNSSMIRLGNVNPNFQDGVIIYDPTNNTYANVINLFVANGSTLTTTFGDKFNQTSRITIYSNTNNFYTVGENVVQQFSGANAIVLDTTHELDLSINNISGSISTGTVLTDANTSANAIILYANSTYIKLTGIQGNFNVGDKVTCLTGNANISAIYNVIIVYDMQDSINFQYNYNITGMTSNAIGYSSLANTITYPDLVKNSGEVIYLNNIMPFTVNLNTKEVFSTVVEF